MFDIGFSELIVCAIVALLVIGPERMPEAVRTVGLWVGRFKRSLRETRSEIERQMGMDDIRRQLHNEEIMRDLEQARRDMDQALSDTQHAIESSAEHATREYTSEPDLPYHSHTEEQAAANLSDASVESVSPQAIESRDSTEVLQDTTQQASEKVSVPAANKALL